jgi:hypothetical protein|tara:strand:- start:333 stop:593 length:261 start_codon:yes stop_codon:yes gene_type:complete
MSMKALLLISTIGGGLDGGYEVEMPSMTECLDARVAVMEQMKDAKTLCVPAVAETDKMEKFFGIFMEIVERMREMENERLNAEANR